MKLSIRMITLGIVLSLFVSSGVLAEHTSINSTSYLPIKKSLSTISTSFAIKFDLSEIPEDINIDLAELTITTSSDTSLGETVNIVIHSALSSWSSSVIPSDEILSISDSLFRSNISNTGNDKTTETNVTKLVKLWYEGDITNNGFVVSIHNNDVKSFTLDKDGNDYQATLSVYYSR